jgi:hypothetical protein
MLTSPRGGGFDEEELAARIGACDLFLSLVPWHSSSMDRLVARLKPAHSIGFCSAFDDNCGPGDAPHSADVAFTLPRRLDPALRIEDFAQPPRWPAEAVERASAIRRQIPADMRALVVHADTSSAKMWPAEGWRCFLDLVLSRFTRFVVLVVGRIPLPIVPERHRHRVAQCYDLSLGAAMALVGQADIFAGIDSCMLHAADLCGVPGIGLFGPTDPAEFGFRFAHHRHVIGRAGMPSIRPEEVIEAFEQLARHIEHRRLESIATGIAGRRPAERASNTD